MAPAWVWAMLGKAQVTIFSADSKLGGLSSLVTSADILRLILNSFSNGDRNSVQEPQQNKTLLQTGFRQANRGRRKHSELVLAALRNALCYK